LSPTCPEETLDPSNQWRLGTWNDEVDLMLFCKRDEARKIFWRYRSHIVHIPHIPCRPALHGKLEGGDEHCNLGAAHISRHNIYNVH